MLFREKTFKLRESGSVLRIQAGFDGGTDIKEQNFVQLINANGYRAILSGGGGDEFLGGVPTGLPELANYMAAGEFTKFLRLSIPWCISERKPLVHKIKETLGYLGSIYLDSGPESNVA